MGATVPLAVGRQASDLDRPAPSMSRGTSAAHHRRWAASDMSLGFGGFEQSFWGKFGPRGLNLNPNTINYPQF